MEGAKYDVSSVTSNGVDSGVAHGALLIRFTDATHGDDPTELEAASEDLVRVLGNEALVDAAAIVATFNQMDRIADATGIPLDAMLQLATADLRGEIGIENFPSARNTPRSGTAMRLAARAMAPLRSSLMRAMARWESR